MAQAAARVLVIDDDPDVLEAARLLLKQRSIAAVTVNRPDQAPRALNDGSRFDAVLLDLNFRRGDQSGAEGLGWIDRILAIDADLPVICITAFGEVSLAVEAMRRGAADYVVKPWDNEKLAATVSAAIRLRRSQREAATSRSRARELALPSPGETVIIGRSAAHERVMELVARVAPTDASVFISGENGVGKEVVARAIHRWSHRRDAPFVAVDLGAVPGQLAESELFGHRKGAFTDSKEDRLGRFAAADGGTLFLDEVANAPPQLQAKLLSALERREIMPVGGDAPRPIDVRLISATNAPREVLEDAERLRPDLLHRLKTIEIAIPPLRARPEDIPLLVTHFAEELARKHAKPFRAADADALAALAAYPWPGNVRELRQAVERAVVLADGASLTTEDFALPQRTPALTGASRAEPTTLTDLERDALERTLRRHEGNITRAAGELGITRASLYRRMKKHGL